MTTFEMPKEGEVIDRLWEGTPDRVTYPAAKKLSLGQRWRNFVLDNFPASGRKKFINELKSLSRSLQNFSKLVRANDGGVSLGIGSAPQLTMPISSQQKSNRAKFLLEFRQNAFGLCSKAWGHREAIRTEFKKNALAVCTNFVVGAAIKTGVRVLLAGNTPLLFVGAVAGGAVAGVTGKLVSNYFTNRYAVKNNLATVKLSDGLLDSAKNGFILGLSSAIGITFGPIQAVASVAGGTIIRISKLRQDNRKAGKDLHDGLPKAVFNAILFNGLAALSGQGLGIAGRHVFSNLHFSSGSNSAPSVTAIDPTSQNLPGVLPRAVGTNIANPTQMVVPSSPISQLEQFSANPTQSQTNTVVQHGLKFLAYISGAGVTNDPGSASSNTVHTTEAITTSVPLSQIEQSSSNATQSQTDKVVQHGWQFLANLAKVNVGDDPSLTSSAPGGLGASGADASQHNYGMTSEQISDIESAKRLGVQLSQETIPQFSQNNGRDTWSVLGPLLHKASETDNHLLMSAVLKDLALLNNLRASSIKFRLANSFDAGQQHSASHQTNPIQYTAISATDVVRPEAQLDLEHKHEKWKNASYQLFHVTKELLRGAIHLKSPTDPYANTTEYRELSGLYRDINKSVSLDMDNKAGADQAFAQAAQRIMSDKSLLDAAAIGKDQDAHTHVARKLNDLLVRTSLLQSRFTHTLGVTKFLQDEDRARNLARAYNHVITKAQAGLLEPAARMSEMIRDIVKNKTINFFGSFESQRLLDDTSLIDRDVYKIQHLSVTANRGTQIFYDKLVRDQDVLRTDSNTYQVAVAAQILDGRGLEMTNGSNLVKRLSGLNLWLMDAVHAYNLARSIPTFPANFVPSMHETSRADVLRQSYLDLVRTPADKIPVPLSPDFAAGAGFPDVSATSSAGTPAAGTLSL